MPSARKLHVLTVDDTPVSREVLNALLKRMGHTVTTAENGAEGVEKFRTERPDVVFMDAMMPVMDGYEATRQIKALAGDHWVPVIFLSMLENEDDLIKGLEAGGDDYLAKPVNYVVLSAKLRSLSRALSIQWRLDDALRRVEVVSDSLIDCVITIDEHAIIQSANLATEKVFGYRREEMIGQNVNLLMAEPHHSAHDGYVGRYVGGGPPRIIGIGREVPARRKDGSLFDAELGITATQHDGRQLFIGLVRDISERKRAEAQLKEYAEKLQRHHDTAEEENLLAQQIMVRQVYGQRLKDPCLHYWVEPTQHFSGDVVAAVRTPDGRMIVMLADATGHGLAAAISVLQVFNLFNALAGINLPLADIVRELNNRICETMPVGRFVAASFVSFDMKGGRGEIWIGGMPEVLWIDAAGKVARRFCSQHLPLGIGISDAETEGEPAAEVFDCRDGGQLLLCSDGLLEAENTELVAFGEARLVAAITADNGPAARCEAIRHAVHEHLAGAAAHDDISFVMVDMDT